MESEEGKGFPPDVIVDILSRLPLKSLVRFRCVSKLWLHTLTHSRFPYWLLSLHLHCDPLKDCNHKQPSLILQFPESSSLTKLFSIGGNHHDDAFKVGSEIDFPLFRGRPFEIKSTCCDGMVCLAAEVDSTPTLVLWNPALRDYKVLPLPSESRVCEAVCGLGFDSSMDDYKVVSVSEGQAFSFSLKRNCWRIIGDFGYHLFHHGLAANGCLYWPAGKSNSVADRILRLNLSDDVFSEVRLPSSFNQPSSSLEDDESLQRRELRLFLKGNLLCVFREYDQSLWAMKEDRETGGVARETWKKLMTIPKFRNREIHFQIGEFRIYHRLYPKCFTKSGKLLFCVKGEKFVLYDPKELHYEALHICGLGDGPFSNVIAYTESLISPDSIRGMNDID